MATVGISDITNVLMDKYQKDIPYLTPKYIPLWNAFTPKEVSFDGEYKFIIPAQYQYNESGSSVTMLSASPLTTALKPAWDQMYLYLKKVLSTMDLSEEVIDLTKGTNALVDGLSRNIEGTIIPHLMLVDSYMHLNGDGILASAVSVNSQVVTVDTTKHLRIGMVLDGYDSANNHDADGIVVTAINSGTTFTCTGTVSSVDSSTKFYKEGSWITSGYTAATVYTPQGIGTIINESDPTYGSFQNLDRDTKTYGCAVVRDASDAGGSAGTATDLTLMRIIHTLDSCQQDSNLIPDIGYTSFGVRNAFYQVMKNNNQPIETLPAKDGLPAGLKFVYNGKEIPIIDSWKADASTMYFINKDHLFRYMAGTWRWEDKSGSRLIPISDYHGFRGIYFGHINWGTDFPRANARLNDITEVTY